ncbi:MAG: FIST C-terminal domain-containing protein [Nitrospinae bacterium]|nr:FIST C-terminal domain-containing protein [Nitrospinota bacterium]
MKIALGHSDDIDAHDAIKDVLEQCSSQLNDEVPDAAILFSGIDFEHKTLLDEIYKAYPDIKLIGCTGDAEMSSKLGIVEDSVVLACFSSKSIFFSSGVGHDVSKNVAEAARKAVESAKNILKETPKLCFVLHDTLTASGLKILSELKNNLPKDVPVLGGAAADHFRMEHSFQFSGNEVLEDSIAVLLIGGGVKFSYGVAAGRSTTGELQKVTSVIGNRVYKIGSQTAVEYYKKYLGTMDDVIGEFPLGVFDKNNKEHYLRAPSHYHEDGSVVFFADIPEGSEVQVTVANRDEIVGAVKTAYEEAIKRYPGEKPALMQVTSCAGRKSVLGTKVKKEYELLKDFIQGLFPFIGYYGFGEICPLENNQDSKFHNETIVILLLGDE